MNSNIENDPTSTVLINKKKEAICNYYKSLVKNQGIDASKQNINTLKKEILAKIAVHKNGVKNNESETAEVLNELQTKMVESDKLAGKILSGTQLKRDVYEENTTLTVNLIYYILGMGFMGYYIIKLLKK